MEIQDFNEKMIQMTKPDIPNLKHQDMLASAVCHAKDKSVVSWWWLSIPIYLLAAFLMKSIYMPKITWLLSLHEFSTNKPYSSFLLFIILPLLSILINGFSIRKVYLLSNIHTPRSILKHAWFNVLMIAISILILIIYSL